MLQFLQPDKPLSAPGAQDDEDRLKEAFVSNTNHTLWCFSLFWDPPSSPNTPLAPEPGVGAGCCRFPKQTGTRLYPAQHAKQAEARATRLDGAWGVPGEQEG